MIWDFLTTQSKGNATRPKNMKQIMKYNNWTFYFVILFIKGTRVFWEWMCRVASLTQTAHGLVSHRWLWSNKETAGRPTKWNITPLSARVTFFLFRDSLRDGETDTGTLGCSQKRRVWVIGSLAIKVPGGKWMAKKMEERKEKQRWVIPWKGLGVIADLKQGCRKNHSREIETISET